MSLRRLGVSKFLFCLLSLLVFALSAGRAANLLVRNNNDAGPGSLRQAIQDNNGLGGGNSVVFSNIVTGVITLLGPELEISADLSIIGPGANVLTVSGNHSVRVFNVTGGSLSVSDLTIANGLLANGDVGAGIQNLSSLTVSNCLFLNNSNTFPNIGGAIYNHGLAMIVNSTFQGNSSGGGGALFLGAQAFITNCTFIANSAIANGRGGAIWSSTPNTVALYSCTIVSNNAPQAQSGGGIYVDAGSPYVRNSIIANNIAGSNPDASGIFISRGYNFIGNAGNTVWSGVGDQVGSSGNRLNPLLGPLSDNGSSTPTMRPLEGSPVIDQGYTGGGFDQRGFPRPIDLPDLPNATGGDGSDIGAVESGPASPRLNIQAAGPDVILFWSTNAMGFRLQSVSNFSASNSWRTTPGTPSIIGNQFYVTNSVSNASTFYRLIFP